MEKNQTFTVRNVTLRALLIYKDKNYLITTIKAMMLKCVDGSFVTHYPDNYTTNGRQFFLLRIDREKNAVVFTEKGSREGESSGHLL